MQRQIIYYALGGGWGHLSRALAVVESLDLDDVLILCTQKQDLAIPQRNIKLCPVPQPEKMNTQSLVHWLQSIITKEKAQDFYIDSFPNGILGELSFLNLDSLSLHYVARKLNMKPYAKHLTTFTLKIEQTWICEELPSNQTEWIQTNSLSSHPLKLQYPLSRKKRFPLQLNWNKYYLIVHSGPASELIELYAYANYIAEKNNEKVKFLVISPCYVEGLAQHPGCICLSYSYAQELFPLALKIFTARGFNLWQQTKLYRNKHFSIPFSRKYDLQSDRY